jgi:hypothetical protein
MEGDALRVCLGARHRVPLQWSAEGTSKLKVGRQRQRVVSP